MVAFSALYPARTTPFEIGVNFDSYEKLMAAGDSQTAENELHPGGESVVNPPNYAITRVTSYNLLTNFVLCFRNYWISSKLCTVMLDMRQWLLIDTTGGRLHLEKNNQSNVHHL